MKQISNDMKNIDYADFTSKKNDLIQVSYHEEHFDDDSITMKTNTTNNRITLCFFCKKQMEIKEGIIFYNSNWFHDSCWNKFGELKK